MILAVVALFAVSLGMAWLVGRGLQRGETWSPTKRATRSRAVTRADDPALFWVSLGLYTVTGLGTTGLAVWALRESRPKRPGSPNH